MEKISRLTYSLVALVVMVLVIVTVALPVITSTIDKQVSVGQNADYQFTSEVGSNLNVSIVYDASEDTISVGDYVVSLSNGSVRYIFVSDAISIRGNNDRITIFDTGNKLRTSITDDIVITITDGTYSYPKGSGTQTGTITGNCLLASDNGTFGAWFMASNPNIIINADSPIWAAYCENGASTYLVSIAKGTASTMASVVCMMLNDGSSVDAVYSITTQNLGNQSMKITAATLAVSDVTYTFDTVFAPIDYIYHTQEQSTARSLLSILPLLLLTIPIIAVVRIFASRGD